MESHRWDSCYLCQSVKKSQQQSRFSIKAVVCGLLCSLWTVMCGSSMLMISSPGRWAARWGWRALCPLGWRRINAGASGLCLLLSAGLGMKSSVHRGKKKRVYALIKGTTGEALQERRWGSVWMNVGLDWRDYTIMMHFFKGNEVFVL